MTLAPSRASEAVAGGVNSGCTAGYDRAIVLVAERHVEARLLKRLSRSRISRPCHHRQPPALASRASRVDAGTAVLLLAFDANECTLAVRDGRPSSSLTRSGTSRHRALAPPSNGGRKSSTNRPAKGLRITAIPNRMCDRSQRSNAELGDDHLAQGDDFADVVETIKPPCLAVFPRPFRPVRNKSDLL
jgi:hypothetical protein